MEAVSRFEKVIPAEIRNRIYDYVLVIDKALIVDAPVKTWNALVHRRKQKPQLSIMAVNKRIRSETVPRFYSRNTFAFGGNEANPLIHTPSQSGRLHFLANVPLTSLELIRNIEVSIEVEDRFDTSAVYNVQRLEFCTMQLKSCLQNLESVKFVFPKAVNAPLTKKTLDYGDDKELWELSGALEHLVNLGTPVMPHSKVKRRPKLKEIVWEEGGYDIRELLIDYLDLEILKTDEQGTTHWTAWNGIASSAS